MYKCTTLLCTGIDEFQSILSTGPFHGCLTAEPRPNEQDPETPPRDHQAVRSPLPGSGFCCVI